MAGALTVPFSSQVALVQWTESVGLTLVGRDQSSVQLRSPGGHILNFTILQIFPFTYESKRMGIIVRVRAARAGYLGTATPGAATPGAAWGAHLAWPPALGCHQSTVGQPARAGLSAGQSTPSLGSTRGDPWKALQ